LAIKQILRIAFIISSLGSLYFVLWLLLKAWILPLPETVQEQLDEGNGHGFDGMSLSESSGQTAIVLCHSLK
jgi:D-alanyl-D-alanine carboxypeptidase